MPKAARAAFGSTQRESGLRVLLTHHPESADVYRRFGFDLVISGHTHGGQARVPFIMNGLYASGQGFFPPLAGGLYDRGDHFQIVSRGLGGYPVLPRVFNPPELVILDTVGGGKGL
jgi:predicted MPP superfamily phosphohydrolase